MENNSNTRKVNGKDVNPTSDLIVVEKLDWSKLNTDINEYLHGRMPERKDDEFYFDDSHSGLIEIDSSICLLITKECVGIEPKIFDYKQGIVGFNVGIFVKSKDPKIEIIEPEFNFRLTANELPKIKTGKKLLLPDFMDERYRYNTRIIDNEHKIITFLEKNNYHRFKNLKK